MRPVTRTLICFGLSCVVTLAVLGWAVLWHLLFWVELCCDTSCFGLSCVVTLAVFGWAVLWHLLFWVELCCDTCCFGLSCVVTLAVLGWAVLWHLLFWVELCCDTCCFGLSCVVYVSSAWKSVVLACCRLNSVLWKSSRDHFCFIFPPKIEKMSHLCISLCVTSLILWL